MSNQDRDPAPPPDSKVDPKVAAALGKVEDFITKTTGKAPSPDELADALTRYFVLNEILGFIRMERGEE